MHGARRGAAAVRLPAVGRGARRRADDGVGRGVRPAAVYLRGGRVFVLVHAFVVNDFTVAYVAGNSNTQLPVWYRWPPPGAHEGSLLLWVLLMSGWTTAVAVFSRPVPADIVARVLAVMGMVCAGFLAFILFTSGPFARTLPAFPVEGAT